MLEGSLAPRVLGLVVEWAAQHRDELRANWELARRHAPLHPIRLLEQDMLRDIVSIEPTGNYRLRLRFEDGVEGEIDLAAIVPFEGVFAPLRDPKVFDTVKVDPALGTICWPNGADLDPDVLYAIVTGKPIPDLTLPPADTRTG